MRTAIVCLVLAACTPSPAPNPPAPLDASDASTSQCAAACAVMSSLHCSGLSSDCAVTMSRLEADRLIRAPNGQPVTCACVASAKTPADVTACGVGCL